MSNEANRYRHRISLAIRYGDIDTLGHVNNAVYLTYVEQARIAYIHHLGLWDGAPSTQGMIVARVAIDYKAALTLTDAQADIHTRVSKLGNRSLVMQHEIHSSGDSPKLAAEVEVTCVAFNYDKNETIPVSERWREVITAFEPGL